MIARNSFFKKFIPSSPPTTSSFNFFLSALITLSVESIPTSALINNVSKSSKDSGVSGSSPNLSNNSDTKPFLFLLILFVIYLTNLFHQLIFLFIFFPLRSQDHG